MQIELAKKGVAFWHGIQTQVDGVLRLSNKFPQLESTILYSFLFKKYHYTLNKAINLFRLTNQA